MNINQDRLWDRLHELGEIGKQDNGGVTRLSFTETEKKAKALVKQYMKEAGLRVWEDGIGNIFGRREGSNSSGKVILMGSHIDSVNQGGIFDGPVGVLTAIEVAQTMEEQDVNIENPIDVVVFTDEEGTRFSTGMLGSKALVGELSYQDLRDNKDADGITIADAMINQGLDPEKVDQVQRQVDTIKGYIEVHIEQGQVLENENVGVGLVTGIVGLRWLQVTLKGTANHAGTTPMNLRKDPLAASAEIIYNIEKMIKEHKGSVATVGQFTVSPGSTNVIPGEVSFTIDLRDISEERLNQLQTNIHNITSTICNQRGVTLEIEEQDRVSPVSCSDEIMQVISKAIEDQQGKVIKLPSGAGHDAMVVGNHVPTAMIFVRTKDGVSHHPDEWAEKEDIGLATEMLYQAVLDIGKTP